MSQYTIVYMLCTPPLYKQKTIQQFCADLKSCLELNGGSGPTHSLMTPVVMPLFLLQTKQVHALSQQLPQIFLLHFSLHPHNLHISKSQLSCLCSELEFDLLSLAKFKEISLTFIGSRPDRKRCTELWSSVLTYVDLKTEELRTTDGEMDAWPVIEGFKMLYGFVPYFGNFLCC